MANGAEDRAEYNWLSRLDPAGEYDEGNRAWVIPTPHDSAADAIIAETRDLCDYLGYEFSPLGVELQGAWCAWG